MAYLTQQNIAEDYIRRKTHKMIKLTSLSQAMEIVVRNRRDQSPYLFPILSFYHTTEQQRRNRIRKVIAKINLCLKLINKELNICVNLTTYVARHSFATALKRSGVSITNDHIRFRQITRRDRLCKGDLNDPLYKNLSLSVFQRNMA